MNTQIKKGLFYASSAYVLWGILPFYWKMLSFITPFEILANRFIHSFIFALVLIFFTSNKSDFLSECKFIFSNHKRILALIAASLSITTNWGLYIWAVNSNHIISASLGYYINPLVSVLLGIIFLKEKLNLAQGIAFFLSALGVLNMVWGAGGFPWISLVLAFSFGFYGLIKKILPVSAISSIAIETAMIMPIMLLYEFYLASKSASVYQNISPGYFLLLLGSGIVTATPLMLFSAAARLLSLKALGFLQYMSPTLSMIIGIFVYKETFTFAHFISFGLIWLGLAVFSFSQFGSNHKAS